MKKLVIIHGVTGAIGSACFALFASQKDTIVYGISRKARDFREFCVNKKLPVATLICSISGNEKGDIYPPRTTRFFAQAINSEMFSEVIYIHAVGVYPTEIDRDGNRLVSHDNNADGIDDRCTELITMVFGSFRHMLATETKKPTRLFILGSISDKHEPFAHMSWWKTMKKMKEMIQQEDKNKLPEVVSVVNISSVLCPSEVINRSFVFTATDSNPTYWLMPYEVASFLKKLIKQGQKEKFKEYELFKKLPNFDEHYYEDEKFTPRKIKELFK